MMYPDVDDLLASVIDTFEQYIAPHVDDEYAASLSLTVTELLRSVHVHVALEGEALADDNAELADLLADLRPHVPPDVVTLVDEALASPVDGYPSVARLQRQAEGLRGRSRRRSSPFPTRTTLATWRPSLPHEPPPTPGALARPGLRRTAPLATRRSSWTTTRT